MLPFKRYHIGIDAGQSTGLAVWDREALSLDYYRLTDFWGAYEFCQNYEPEETEVTIEAPKKNGRIFWDKYGEDRRGNPGMAASIGKRVGQVGREAELLAIGLRRHGFTVFERPPAGKKWTVRLCLRATGVHESNENVRDAIRFVWNT